MSFLEALQDALNLWTVGVLPAPRLSEDTVSEWSDWLSPKLTHCPPPQKTRRRWTEPEDQLLREVVQRYQCDWKKVGQHFPGKPKSAVKRRWQNRFDPDLKRTPWTPQEDSIIKELRARIGPVWKEIAKALPGRPPDVVKNRYYGHIKRLQDIRDRKLGKAAVDPTPRRDTTDWDGLLAEALLKTEVVSGRGARTHS